MTEHRTLTPSNLSDFLAAIERARSIVPATDPPGRMDTVPPKYGRLAGMPVIPASLRQLYEKASESAASAARLFALVADKDVDALNLNPDLVSGIYKGMIDEHLDMLGISVADND